MKRIDLKKHDHDAAAAAVVEFLADGGVVLMPFDTSYGLAADAARAEAVDYLNRLKGRSEDEKPLSVLVSGRQQAEAIADFNPAAVRLWDRFLPGPLTLILPLSQGSGLRHGSADTVGIRYPEHDFAVEVAERFERPYTTTSANLTGQPPAYEVDEFLNALDADLPHLVIDAGPLPIRPVSTVADVSAEPIRIVRVGAIPESEIFDALD